MKTFLTSLLLLAMIFSFSVPASAQEDFTVLPVYDPEQALSGVELPNQNSCATARMTQVWSFISQGFHQLVYFYWDQTEPACFMNFAAEVSSTEFLYFEAIQRSSTSINCDGSSQKRITCTAPGNQGPYMLTLKLTSRPDVAGRTDVAFNEVGGNFVRLYTVYTRKDGFMNFGPWITLLDRAHP